MADPRVSGVSLNSPGVTSRDVSEGSSKDVVKPSLGESMGVSSASVTAGIPSEAWGLGEEISAEDVAFAALVTDLSHGPVLPMPEDAPAESGSGRLDKLARGALMGAMQDLAALQIDEESEAVLSRLLQGGVSEDVLGGGDEESGVSAQSRTRSFDWRKKGTGFGLTFALGRLAFIRMARQDKKLLRFESFNEMMMHKDFQMLMQKVENRYKQNKALYSSANVQQGAEFISDHARDMTQWASNTPFSKNNLRQAMDESYAELEEGAQVSEGDYSLPGKRSGKVEKKAASMFAPLSAGAAEGSTEAPEAKAVQGAGNPVLTITSANTGLTITSLDAVDVEAKAAPAGASYPCMPRTFFTPGEIDTLSPQDQQALRSEIMFRDSSLGYAYRVGRVDLHQQFFEAYGREHPEHAQLVQARVAECKSESEANQVLKNILRDSISGISTYDASFLPFVQQFQSSYQQISAEIDKAHALADALERNRSATPPKSVKDILDELDYWKEEKNATKRESLIQQLEQHLARGDLKGLRALLCRHSERELEELCCHARTMSEAAVGLWRGQHHMEDYTVGSSDNQVSVKKIGVMQQKAQIEKLKKDHQDKITAGQEVPYHRAALAKAEADLARLDQEWGLLNNPVNGKVKLLGLKSRLLEKRQEVLDALDVWRAAPEREGARKSFFQVYNAWRVCEYLIGDPPGLLPEWKALPEDKRPPKPSSASQLQIQAQQPAAPADALTIVEAKSQGTRDDLQIRRSASAPALSMSLRRTQSASDLRIQPRSSKASREALTVETETKAPDLSFPDPPRNREEVMALEKGRLDAVGMYFSAAYHKEPRRFLGFSVGRIWGQVLRPAMGKHESAWVYSTQNLAVTNTFAGMAQENVGLYNRNLRALEQVTQGMADRILQASNAALR